MLHTIRLRNLLSFGPGNGEIGLGPLNVLIGPNASGKSNLIEVLSLLRAAPKDLQAPIREGGGVSEWLWRGTKETPTAEINVTIDNPDGTQPLRYRLEFTMTSQRFELVDEAVENERPHHGQVKPYFYYRYQDGHPVLNVRKELAEPTGTERGRVERSLQREDIDPSQSVLSQRKDPDQYPELTFINNLFSRFALFREWNLGRYTPPRLPQKADLPSDFLLEDASNLGLVLNELEHRPGVKRLLTERLKAFCDSIEDFTIRIHGGTVQLFLHEAGLHQPIPATRLSDGTLRYLCLLSILCHPDPPKVICIEEPELGLHTDVLATVADLLIEASGRTQLFVTTHSDVLVSALTNTPESVLVCERTDAGTSMRRLEKKPLEEWLEKYSLGELWRMGEIGGTRW